MDKVTLSQMYDWLSIEDIPRNSNLIFVFGSPTLDAVEKALELYNLGFAKFICVNGNKSLTEPCPETPVARWFSKFLLENGVDANQIIIQDQSVNTFEDVQFSFPMILTRINNLKRIILVTRPFHQRRAYETIRKLFPGYEYLNVPSRKQDLSNISENDLAILTKFCLSEVEKLNQWFPHSVQVV